MKRVKPGTPIKDRLKVYSKTDAGSGCLEWIGAKRKGYGRLRIAGKDYAAHKLSWIESNGPIPNGMWVLHRCDNPACIQPSHLFLGTAKDNFDDMHCKGRYTPPRGEKQPNAKLNADKVLSLRKLYAKGMQFRQMAKAFGINEATIKDCVRGETWSHIPGGIPSPTPLRGRVTRREE